MSVDSDTRTAPALGMRARPWKQGRIAGLAAIAVVLLAALAPLVAAEYLLTAATVVLFSCYLAQCWNLAAGYAGQFSLGHALFLGIGGYTSTVLFLNFGISPWFGALAGAVLAAIAGAALSALAFRFQVKGVFFAVITLSAAEVGRSLFEEWNYIGGTSGLMMVLSDQPQNMMFLSRVPYYELILAMVVLIGLGTWALERSRFGQQLKALREDEAAAEATGVPTFRCKVAIITISAACSALAGTFYAQFLLFIVPETLFSFEHTLTMMLGAMIGGIGTIFGPIFGAVLFGSLSEVLRSLPLTGSREVASLLRIVYALVLIVIVLRLPGGLISLLRRRKGA